MGSWNSKRTCTDRDPEVTRDPAQNYSSVSEYHGNAAPAQSYSYAAPCESYAPQSRESNNKLKRRYSRIADDYNSFDQVSNDKLKRRYSRIADDYNSLDQVSNDKLKRRYSRIADDYNSFDQVTAALTQAGLESSNLIVGIDFTKSNEWTGTRSFNRRSLHHIGDSPNPYEQAIKIIGKTLSVFDEDNLIPCFGFGDASTHDQDVFSFYEDKRQCSGFEEALRRYREIVPHLRLAGPTSFAPIIEMGITIVEQSGGQYHVLLIIADGQVTRNVDSERGHLSPQEQSTVEAIVRASQYPLSIILVGVGDGPWDMMKEFDDNIPARLFDNFQFVNFTENMSKNMPSARQETEFALAALMEIPSQYKATMELNILGRRTGKSPNRIPLPPPMGRNAMPSFPRTPSQSSSFQHSSPRYHGHAQSVSAATAPPASSSGDNQFESGL